MIRIQRQRTKGWRMPPGAKYVGRPTRWGNTCRLWACEECDLVGNWDHEGPCQPTTPEDAVLWYRVVEVPVLRNHPEDLDPLRGATALACWCPLDQACHADVLIELLAATP